MREAPREDELAPLRYPLSRALGGQEAEGCVRVASPAETVDDADGAPTAHLGPREGLQLMNSNPAREGLESRPVAILEQAQRGFEVRFLWHDCDHLNL